MREHHLSYCRVCKNKENNLKNGIICGLTKKKAEFVEKCENYNEDKKLVAERIEKIKEKINEKYPKQNLTTKVLSSNYYKSSSEIKAQNVKKVKKKTTEYNPIHFRVLFYAMLLMLIYLIIIKFDKLLDIQNNQNEIYNFGLSIIFIGFLYYSGFVKKYNKEKIKIDNLGIYFRQTENGFKYENKSVKWNEIVEYGIVTKPNKHYYMYSIIFGTKNLEILEMDVSSMELSPEQYIGIINEKIKNVA